MNIKELYETKYAFDAPARFEDYERNRLLARVAPAYCRAGQRMLDLGCNDGLIADWFRKLGLTVAGLDISERALDMARQRGLTDLKQGDVERPLPYEDAEFDLVFWGDNVEHVFEPLKVLGEIRRILKPGGRLILSTPNTGYVWFRIYYFLKGIMPRTEGHVNPPWEWEHIRFFNKPVMRQFLAAGGFEMDGFWTCNHNRFLDRITWLAPSLLGAIMLVSAVRRPG